MYSICVYVCMCVFLYSPSVTSVFVPWEVQGELYLMTIYSTTIRSYSSIESSGCCSVPVVTWSKFGNLTTGAIQCPQPAVSCTGEAPWITNTLKLLALQGFEGGKLGQEQAEGLQVDSAVTGLTSSPYWSLLKLFQCEVQNMRWSSKKSFCFLQFCHHSEQCLLHSLYFHPGNITVSPALPGTKPATPTILYLVGPGSPPLADKTTLPWRACCAHLRAAHSSTAWMLASSSRRRWSWQLDFCINNLRT